MNRVVFSTSMVDTGLKPHKMHPGVVYTFALSTTKAGKGAFICYYYWLAVRRPSVSHMMESDCQVSKSGPTLSLDKVQNLFSPQFSLRCSGTVKSGLQCGFF